MRTILAAWILCLPVLGSAQLAHAASYAYAIDLSFPFEPIRESAFAVEGTHRAAGSFEIDESLLPANAITFVPYGRFDSFTLDLPVLSLGQENLDRGTCSGIFPLCGMLFLGSQPQTLVGQFAIPGTGGLFSVSFNHTGAGFPSADPLFQGVSIHDLRLGVTVASGFVAVRPVPEPSSLLLLSVGGLLVGRAARRRSAAAAPPR